MTDQPMTSTAPASPIANAISVLTSAARMAAADHVEMRAKLKRTPTAERDAELAQAFDVIGAASTLIGSLFLNLERIASAHAVEVVGEVREPGPGLAGAR